MAGQGSQVKKSCACCVRYLDHLRGKMTSFLMPMSANYRHNMTMPARFMNQFGGEISESIDIESPDGSVYAVKGTKYMNKMLPQCGWKAFVDAHRIEENDSLLFQRIEKARFKVLIIDPDGCEKVFPCDGIKISTTNVQEGDTDCIDVSESSRDSADKSSRVRKRVSSCQRDCPSQRRKAARIARTTASSSEESGPDSEGTAEYEWSSGSDDDPKTNAAPNQYVLSRLSILSEEQEEEVDGLIKEIQPETTVFVAVMKPSNVKLYPTLVIPHGYAAAHFPHTSRVVTLQRPGKNRKWHAKLHVRKNRTAHVFSGPWSDFVRDNHVQEGDICVFQPLKTAGIRFTLMVHLIRQSKAAEHGSNSPPSPSPGPGTSSSRGRTTTRTKLAEEPDRIVQSGECSRLAKAKMAATVTPAARVKEEEEPAGQAPSPCNCHLTGDDESGDSGGPPSKTGGLYVLGSHAHLTDERRKKVEDIVGSIQPQVPVYVAVMNKTSVADSGTCILYFGKQYTSKYLPEGEHTVTLVRNGKSSAWKVKMYAQMFTKGWRGFVRDNRLKLEDICLFHLTKDDIKMLTMTVYIIRHV